MTRGLYHGATYTCRCVVSLAALGLTVWAADPPMRVSDRGVRFVEQWEGFRERPYTCPGGHATIGYGHLIHRGPVDGTEPERWRTEGISLKEARELLRRDLGTSESCIIYSVRVPLSQAQFDTLVSFVHNVGITAFRSSTLLIKLNAGLYEEIPGELKRWTKAGGKVLKGLEVRRREEVRLWLSKV